MIVVIAKLRATPPQAAQELCRVHRHAFAWYQRPGSLGARCMLSKSDPQQMVVVEQWSSRAAFDAWYNTLARVKYEQQLAHLWEGTYQFEVYEEV